MSDALDSSSQYIRICQLIVYDNDLNGLDLSELRIKFSVKRSNVQTPNTADIRIYNLEEQTAFRIRKEFRRVVLQAGYVGDPSKELTADNIGNIGVIFQGNIKQVIIGRESATDTFIDIVAGDGDLAYNFAIVSTTLAAGSTQADQINASIGAMNKKGVTGGHIGDLPTTALPRGKVMYGPAKTYLRNSAETTDKDWSIQDEKVTFVSKKSYLPGEVVVITSQSGMIGAPQQTNEGINIKCLLNPLLKMGGRIQVDNASVQRLKIDQQATGKEAILKNTPARLTEDGVYFLLVVEHQGDNRGTEWYSNLVCLNIDVTTNPLNSIGVG